MNRVVLVGRLARDPNELRRSVSTNVATISFTIAVDRQSKQQDQSADFISCVAFNKTAEFVEMYFRKGLLVGVDGRLQSRSYDGRDGKKVYVTEVVCDNVQILEPKNSSSRPVNNEVRQDVPSVEPIETARPEYDIGEDELPF